MEWIDEKEREGEVLIYMGANVDETGRVGVAVIGKGMIGEFIEGERFEVEGWERFEGMRIVIVADSLQIVERKRNNKVKEREVLRIRRQMESMSKKGVEEKKKQTGGMLGLIERCGGRGSYRANQEC